MTIHLGSAVYIRYKDHVLFRRIKDHVAEHAERETVGWLIGEDPEAICIHWDRNVRRLPYQKTSSNSGLLILKSCIIEIQEIPLQRKQNGSLNCQTNKLVSTEYAFQPKKRKTQQPKIRTGATK
jgi:hypothetical protein